MRGGAVAPDKPLIYLTGFMCSGKSTVGPLLAAGLGWRFTDTDALVEELAGTSIADIFTTHGEPYFRELEGRALAHVCSLKNYVVALGGGAILEPANARVVSETGALVYLCWQEEALFERISASPERPLAPTGLGEREVLRRLFEQRRPAYERADIILRCEVGMEPQEISQILLREIMET